MHTYRVSCLASAAMRMWRGWRVLIPVIVVNALIQALLIWPPYVYGQQAWHVVSAIASAIVLWASFGLIACAALLAPSGPVTWTAAIALARPRALALGLWAIAWVIAVALGMAVYAIPGVIIAALLVFLPFAVLAGDANPLKAALALVGRRFWRWLVTVLIAAAVLVIGWLAAGLLAFFVRGPAASSIIWLIGGLLIAWITSAFALVFADDRGSVGTHEAVPRPAS